MIPFPYNEVVQVFNCYEYKYRTILHWCPKRGVEEAPRLIQDNDQDMSNGNMNRDNGYLVSCKGCRKSFKTVKGLKFTSQDTEDNHITQ